MDVTAPLPTFTEDDPSGDQGARGLRSHHARSLQTRSSEAETPDETTPLVLGQDFTITYENLNEQHEAELRRLNEQHEATLRQANEQHKTSIKLTRILHFLGGIVFASIVAGAVASYAVRKDRREATQWLSEAKQCQADFPAIINTLVNGIYLDVEDYRRLGKTILTLVSSSLYCRCYYIDIWHGIVWWIFAMYENITDQEVQKVGMELLAALASNSTYYKMKVAKAGGTHAILTSLLYWQESAELQRAGCAALFDLAIHEKRNPNDSDSKFNYRKNCAWDIGTRATVFYGVHKGKNGTIRFRTDINSYLEVVPGDLQFDDDEYGDKALRIPTRDFEWSFQLDPEQDTDTGRLINISSSSLLELRYDDYNEEEIDHTHCLPEGDKDRGPYNIFGPHFY